MCGMSGYLARQCPTKPSTTRTGSQLRPQGQQNYTYGKVNHESTEEAQQAQDVVLGMFLASSHPATVYSIWEHHIPLYHHHL
jgi:acyl-CoA synthetase (AMP-forming)/AMP-acid ligase II